MALRGQLTSSARGARLAAGSRQRAGSPRDLPVRRLPEGGPSLEVVRIWSGSAGMETGCQLELRQDFHTLFWTRRGSVRQVIDGMPLEAGSPQLTVVGRGQVYRYENPGDIDGAVISFGDDLLYEGPVTRVNPVWLVGRYGAQQVRVPAGEVARLLRFTDLQIGEIASRVGLRNQFYFSRAFKQLHGESPQAYRTRVRDGAASPGSPRRTRSSAAAPRPRSSRSRASRS